MKMNWKRILLVVLCVGLVFALCACSNQSESSVANAEQKDTWGFIEIGRDKSVGSYYHRTYYDPKTLVIYDLVCIYEGGSFSPRYNADGSLMLYDGPTK